MIYRNKRNLFSRYLLNEDSSDRSRFSRRRILHEKRYEIKWWPETREELCELIDDRGVSLGEIDVCGIESFEYIFRGSKRTNFEGIETWDTSSVTDMQGAFSGCEAFDAPIGRWDVSSVRNMMSMFDGCSHFNQPLENWKVSNVTTMANMFRGCSEFNQPLEDWNVSRVRNMKSMFSGCTDFNRSLNNWDILENVKCENMFTGCDSFDFSNIEDWPEEVLSNCRVLNKMRDLGIYN